MSTTRSPTICSRTRNAAGRISHSKNDESYDPEESDWNMTFLYIALVLLS